MKKIIQSGLFSRKVKKLTRQQKLQLDDVVRDILNHPETGEMKKGDLSGIYVHKFKLDHVLFLLAYRFTDQTLELIMLGPNENYYRD